MPTTQRHVPIELRKVSTADAKLSTEMVVRCSLRGRTMRLEECLGCGACGGFSLDPDDPHVACLAAFPRAVPDERRATDAEKVRVGDVMTRDPRSVPPEMAVGDLLDVMVAGNLSAMPVVATDAYPIGVVSKTDVLRAMQASGLESTPRHLTVRDIMSPVVFALRESASLAQAAALMAYEGIHRLLVHDVSGAIIGVLSATDVMRWLGETAGYVVPQPRGSVE